MPMPMESLRWRSAMIMDEGRQLQTAGRLIPFVDAHVHGEANMALCHNDG